MFSSPVTSYSASRIPQSNAIQVYYDDARFHDEEMRYTFNPDGSAMAQSPAWGSWSKCPPGAFSDVMAELSSVKDLNAQIAYNLAQRYRTYEAAHRNEIETSFRKVG